MGAKKGKDFGKNGKGKKGMCRSGEAGILLPPSVYDELKSAVNSATKVTNIFGHTSWKVCLDCAVIPTLLGLVSNAHFVDCKKKKKKKKKKGKQGGK